MAESIISKNEESSTVMRAGVYVLKHKMKQSYAAWYRFFIDKEQDC